MKVCSLETPIASDMTPSIGYVHPTLLLSLSDHLNRHTAYTAGSASTLFGLILGRHTKGESVSLLYSFEIPEIECTSREEFERHLNLLGEVYGKGYLELVGFYVINDEKERQGDGREREKTQAFLLQRQVSLLKDIKSTGSSDLPSLLKTIDVDENLVFLQFHTPLAAELEASVNLFSLGSNQVRSIPFEIRFLGAEKLSVATYNNAPKMPAKLDELGDSGKSGSVNLKDVASGLQNLHEKLEKALYFLEGVKTGAIKVPDSGEKYEALQALSNLAGRITAIKRKLHESKSAGMIDSSSNADELNELVAVGSMLSSLFRKNMDYSI